MATITNASAVAPHLHGSIHPAGRWIFAALLLGGLLYAEISIVSDTS